jgi:hypothetical protein
LIVTAGSSRGAMIVGVLCSVVMSGIGLSIGLWTGIGNTVSTSFALFWILPTLAFPLLLVKLVWKGMRAVVFWLLFLGQGASLAWSNWVECTHGKCTTNNLLLIALAGLPILRYGDGSS